MAQAQREETARKVHRGMKPKFERDGQFMGGRPYGYRAVINTTFDIRDKGKLEKKPEEAEIVQRIFEEYVAGKSPRDIAHGLNADHIPAPKGGTWNASTINGVKSRGTGILFNSLYVGRPIWNKNRMKKVPDSAKRRVIQLRPKDEHVVHEHPDLRIIDEELFQAAQTRKEERSNLSPSRRQKAKRLLSGRLRCGCCGSGMASMGRDKKTGKTRIICSRHSESRSCPDPVQVYADVVERKVIQAVIDLFSNRENIDAALKKARAEARKAAGAKINERAKLERRQSELARDIGKLTNMLVRGIGDETINDQGGSRRKEGY